MSTRDLVGHDAALGLHEQLAVARQQEDAALGARVLDEDAEQSFEQASEHDLARDGLPGLDQRVQVEVGDARSSGGWMRRLDARRRTAPHSSRARPGIP